MSGRKGVTEVNYKMVEDQIYQIIIGKKYKYNSLPAQSYIRENSKIMVIYWYLWHIAVQTTKYYNKDFGVRNVPGTCHRCSDILH